MDISRGPGYRRPLFWVAFKYREACVEVARRQMGVAHRHLQRLVPQPHLDTPQVDPAAHQPRSAGVPQDMRHHVGIAAEAAILLGGMPHGPELLLLYMDEGPTPCGLRRPKRLLRALRQGDGPAFPRLGDPERDL